MKAHIPIPTGISPDLVRLFDNAISNWAAAPLSIGCGEVKELNTLSHRAPLDFDLCDAGPSHEPRRRCNVSSP